jgi:hypothetical protein
MNRVELGFGQLRGFGSVGGQLMSIVLLLTDRPVLTTLLALPCSK